MCMCFWVGGVVTFFLVKPVFVSQRKTNRSSLITFSFSFLCFKYFQTWAVTAHEEGSAVPHVISSFEMEPKTSLFPPELLDSRAGRVQVCRMSVL